MIPGCISRFTYLNSKVVNSSFVDAPQANRVFYDVLRVHENIPLFLEDHAERFFKTFQLAQVQVPFDIDFLKLAIHELLEKDPISVGNIRVVYYDSDIPVFAVYRIAHIYPEKNVYYRGVSSELLRAERENPNIKQELEVKRIANQRIVSHSIFDVIYIDSNNYVREGSRTNVFFLKGNTLYTAPEKDVLGGITRKKVLEVAKNENIAVVEEPISVLDLDNFDAAFFTGTSPKVLPITYIDSFRFDVSHPMLLKIIQLYDETIRQYIQEYNNNI